MKYNITHKKLFYLSTKKINKRMINNLYKASGIKFHAGYTKFSHLLKDLANNSQGEWKPDMFLAHYQEWCEKYGMRELAIKKTDITLRGTNNYVSGIHIGLQCNKIRRLLQPRIVLDWRVSPVNGRIFIDGIMICFAVPEKDYKKNLSVKLYELEATDLVYNKNFILRVTDTFLT